MNKRQRKKWVKLKINEMKMNMSIILVEMGKRC